MCEIDRLLGWLYIFVCAVGAILMSILFASEAAGYITLIVGWGMMAYYCNVVDTGTS